MKFIIGNRQSGVSTDLLLEASKFDRTIIVPTEAMKKYIKHQCVELNITCPDIFTVGQLKNNILKGQNIDNICISDVGMVLEMLLNEMGYYGKINTVSTSLES